MREFIVANGVYWADEFHIDGFRIDATQNIYDFGEGHEHILAELTRRAREAAAPRRILVVGENEPQAVRLIRPRERGGLGLDALWNDDFHHSAVVALTGRNEAYLSDHQGRPQELVSAAKYGFLYQGQRYRWQKQARGTPALDLEPERLVVFVENHDQLANMGRGFRLHRTAAPGCLRAVTALLLLGPATPMLFMGQEFAASAPFLYFAGFEGELAELVDQGRRKEVSQFPSLGTPELQAVIRRPDDPRTFAACKLDWREAEAHHEALALHRDLLRLRREDESARGVPPPRRDRRRRTRTRGLRAPFLRRRARRPSPARQPRRRPRAGRHAGAAPGPARGPRLGAAVDERAPGLRRGRLAAALARRPLGAAGPGGGPAAARTALAGAQDRGGEGAGEGGRDAGQGEGQEEKEEGG